MTNSRRSPSTSLLRAGGGLALAGIGLDRLRTEKCVDVARRRARRGRNHRRRVCLVAQSQLLVRRKRGRP